MISVVNGYVCNNSCDVESAKKGKDPSAPPGSPPSTSSTSSKTDKTSGIDQQLVTVLDGALKQLSAANIVSAASASQPAGAGARQPSVNLLA
jgi:hypothetical protein